MATGTIALTTNSRSLTGDSTNFIHELQGNDFIVVVVGGVTYTLGVSAVQSDTSLTLNAEYNGPTTSGLTWTPIPAQTLVGITAQIAADTARAIRGLNYEKDNWQKIYSGNSSITVNLPDGSQFTGPSWNYLIKSFGTAANLNAQTNYLDRTPNAVLKVGAFGLGATGVTTSLSDDDMLSWLASSYGQFHRNALNTIYNYGYSASFMSRAADTYASICVGYSGQGIRAVGGAVNKPTFIYDLWTNRNTTIDTNNFIKKASPIARLTNDINVMQSDFATDQEHFISGLVAVNDEAQGVSAEKTGTGVYLVKGSAGLADEGWTLEAPQDINGNRLCFIETETAEDGAITVRVFSRRFDVNTASIVAGDPMDIPCGRWIDLRLQMPADSAWNKRARELDNTADDAEST